MAGFVATNNSDSFSDSFDDSSGSVPVGGGVLDVPVMIGSVKQEGMLFIYEAFGKALSTSHEDALLALIYGAEDAVKVGPKQQ